LIALVILQEKETRRDGHREHSAYNLRMEINSNNYYHNAGTSPQEYNDETDPYQAQRVLLVEHNKHKNNNNVYILSSNR